MRGQTAGIIAFAGITLALLLVSPAQAAQITNAFSKIFVDGVQVLTAKSYNDYLNFVGGTGIDVSYSNPNTITISSTAGPAGDTNTAQIGDAGTHLSIFGSRFNATKNLLKTFTCNGLATCTANATDINITVTAVPASGGAVILAANVTGGTKPSSDTLIWDIPLTANSGNAIRGTVVATSSISGNAVQLGANVTVPSRTSGYCKIIQVSTATADALDNIVMNTVLTGRATNTGETAWIAAAQRPMPITFDCALKSGATTPGSLRLWFAPEVGSTTIQIKAGSFYIKGP